MTHISSLSRRRRGREETPPVNNQTSDGHRLLPRLLPLERVEDDEAEVEHGVHQYLDLEEAGGHRKKVPWP